MAENNRDWSDVIKRFPEWIMGFIVFVTPVVGFIKLWQGDTGLVTVVLLVMGIGGGLLSCLYLAFKRTPPLVEGSSKGVWRYPRARVWALAGLVLIPLLVGGVVCYHLFEEAQPPTKSIVLIADLDGPDPKKYRVTETVLSRLHTELEPYEDVQVVALGRAISEVEGSAAAHTEGERHKAAIVIWGWYGTTEEAVELSVHFEVLRETRCMPEIGPEVRGQLRTMAVAALTSFDLQIELSDEMTYLTLFTTGMTRFAVEDYNGAIAAFDRALNQTTKRVQALDQSIIYFYRGLANDLEHDSTEAIQDYSQAIALDPNIAMAYTNRGTDYDLKGDYDQAIQDFNHSIRLNPNLAITYTNRGVTYADRGDNDQAIQDYNEAIRLRPDDPWAYNNRGCTYAEKGDYTLAIQDYNKAIELNPHLAEIYNNRGNSYVRKGDSDGAIRDYNEAIRLNPDLPMVYNNRGCTYADKGDYDLAIKDYNKTILLDPNLAEAYYNRGRAYADKGDYTLAIRDYTQAILLNPDSPRVYSNRGNIYALKGDYEDAIQDYNRAIRLIPFDAVVYYDRGSTFALKCDYDQAIVDYDQAIHLRPNMAEAYYGRGKAYKRKGEKEKAIDDFDEFLKLSNDPYWREQAEQQLQELSQG